ncbi:MAG: hypothetical protein ACQGVK_21305 [Myxococcota bacterium]
MVEGRSRGRDPGRTRDPVRIHGEVGIGLRAKTARAIAVALVESDEGLVVVDRREIATFDPAHPDSKQPHHAGLDLPESKARPRVDAAEEAVRRAARSSVDALVSDLGRAGLGTLGIAVVGAPVKDPARIGNPHVRAHAAEGQLFRRVLEQAASERALLRVTLDEREAWEQAAAGMHCAIDALRRQVADLGQRIGPPWRADEKLACLGALVVLGSR